MFVWIEGVNFNATMFDTNDLSTIRGSSMWLEQLGAAARAEIGGTLVEFGASQALLEIKGRGEPQIRHDLEKFRALDGWKHFNLIGGIGGTVAAAKADARVRKLSDWTTVPPEAGDGPDPLNGTLATDNANPVNGIAHSPSVNVRRKIGAKARPQLFSDASLYDPPRSFDDIVKSATKLPVVVQNKIAVVVADASGAGEVWKTLAAKKEEAADTGVPLSDSEKKALDFSLVMSSYRRDLAREIERWAVKENLFLVDGTIKRPRVDVLIWGGDDMTFVLPASHLLSFLDMFLTKTAAMKLGDDRLYHRLGCIIASHKAPIRQIRALGHSAEAALKSAAETAKLPKQDLFSIDIFESEGLPHDDIAAFRQPMYGKTLDPVEYLFAGADLDRVKAFLTDQIGAGPGQIAISQLHKILNEARDSGGHGHAEIMTLTTKVEAALEQYFGPDERWKTWTTQNLPVFLARMTQLYPYAHVQAVP